MLLIFPSIEIKRGKCVHVVHGEPGAEHIHSIDPVDMAILWRGENAKTLHVIDLDGVEDGTIRNKDIIRRMVEAVDIPIQLGGGLRTFEDIKSAFEVGVYRIFIRTAAVENPSLVEQVIREYGSRKIAIGIESQQGKLRVRGGKLTDISPVDFALDMRKLGVSRLLVSIISEDGKSKILDTEALRDIATRTGLRVTAQGGIRNYQDLIKLQELEKHGVDSVVIGKPLYENQFPCQRLWRLNEQDLTDMGPTRRP